MKTKSILLTCLFALLASMTVSAQTVVKGDMNDDNDVTIADVTSLVNVVLGKSPMETINAGGSPYMVDNSSVVGTWYAPDGTSFTLNEDGSTNFTGAATYKFRPYQGTLMMFNASGNPIKTLVLNEVETSYLLAIDYATGAYTYYTNSSSLATGITISPATLTMNSGTTEPLTATLSPEGAIGNITWTSSDESVATVDANGLVTAVAGGSCTITATAGGSLKTATCSVTVKQMVTSITLSQTSAVLELDGFVTLTATVLPANAANKNVTWSISNEDVALVTRTGKVIANDYGTAIITCEAADGSGVKATCKVSVLNVESLYVDLGLPSGTLWATCNIGASSPEDYGDYFAWGETTGYNDGKTDFSWSTYFDTDDNGITFKKYNDNDEPTVLTIEIEDDAAYVNWGPTWRMPSKEQCEELINSSYTTAEWITQNGVNGRKITSLTNGKSIFLPAAGNRLNSSLNNAGSISGYWSRTSIGAPYATALISNSGNFNRSNVYRYYGISVRPVRNSE